MAAGDGRSAALQYPAQDRNGPAKSLHHQDRARRGIHVHAEGRGCRAAPADADIAGEVEHAGRLVEESRRIAGAVADRQGGGFGDRALRRNSRQCRRGHRRTECDGCRRVGGTCISDDELANFNLDPKAFHHDQSVVLSGTRLRDGFVADRSVILDDLVIAA